MKPNLKFLRKVANRKVYASFGYSLSKGGYYLFRGGEAAYVKHYKAGYCTEAPTPSIGRPGYVELTKDGCAALAEAEAQP